MRKIIACTLAILCVFVTFGNTATDSVKVYFRLNQATLDPSLGDNAISMESFIERLTAVVASDDLNSLVIYGYTSPEGPVRLNETLAARRCNALANKIMERVAVNPDLIRIKPSGIAWDELRQLVAVDPAVVNERERLLEIIDNNSLSASQRLQQLKNLDDGEPYQWIVDELFPQMRYAMAVAIFRKSNSSNSADQSIDSINCADKPVILSPDSITDGRDSIPRVSPVIPALPKAPEITPADTYSPRHLLALKTNLLYYCALMPNIEIEWLIRKNWSVAANWNIAWWGNYADNNSYRISTIDAEARYWVSPRTYWHGFFVGVFAGGGWYDLQHKGNGYYGEGLMTGISAGYMWPIARNWSMEASVGAGYAFTRCKEYMPFEGHHLYQRTKDINYFGPLKLKLSIAWRFWDINKSKTTAPRP